MPTPVHAYSVPFTLLLNVANATDGNPRGEQCTLSQIASLQLRNRELRLIPEHQGAVIYVGGDGCVSRQDLDRIINEPNGRARQAEDICESCDLSSATFSPQAYPTGPGVHVASPHTLPVTPAIEHPANVGDMSLHGGETLL